MKREIKFRVWDIDRKEWVKNTGNPYVFPFHGKTAMTCAGNRTGHIPDEDYSEEYTLEQFTGQKDRDGADVYENDLWQRGDFIGQVVFEYGGWVLKTHESSRCISYPSFYSNVSLGVVIGNVHGIRYF